MSWKSAIFFVKNMPKIDPAKGIIEKISQTRKRCRDLHQTDFVDSHRRRQKTQIKRDSVRTICLSKCLDRMGKGRGVIGLASNSNHAPPGQAYQFFNSSKMMVFGHV